MTRTTEHPWLTRFAWLTAAATFVLIGVGGLVTSKGAGMAVPDWPTTYGYNMFLFPFHLWTGGIFYEHTHRLVASGVGLLTLILAGWLWARESRPILRWMGLVALLLVIVQGVLGGLRVTLYKDEIGIFHGTLAQLFFALVSAIAIGCSKAGSRLMNLAGHARVSRRMELVTVLATVMIFLQLILGATMRHQHAGLAVPDFPLAYGKLWPPTDEAFLDRVNRQRLGIQEYKPITASHIVLHMSHRIGAVLIVSAVGLAAWFARREQGAGTPLARLTGTWLGLLGLQALLGAATVWSNKAADMATAHVLTGALSLVVGTVITAVVIARRLRSEQAASARSPVVRVANPAIAQPRPVV